ncbi:MAG: hypothetical protein HGGPFJEG_02495 [Ignavibacteria bacterium]|nr:hypothetical protein [Ignavibacteria bacterium]
MNAAHLHLIINHVPVIGTAITLFVLIVGLIKKSDDVKKVSVLILILTALITIPVYVSGDNAEGKIEGNYEDVDESFIEEHEDFAYYSFIAMNITGAIALVSMFIFKKPKQLPNTFTYLLFALLVIVFSMMAYTGNLGGKIHHPEIKEDKLPWEASSTPGTVKEKIDKSENKTSKEDKDNDRENDKEDDDK